jgi:tRNA(Ile)-lysidine synthase
MSETNFSAPFSSPSVAQQSEEVLLSSFADIPTSSHYLIALSGGLDSAVLLRLVVPVLLKQGATVQAVHVHHGYSRNADTWARYCQALCEQLNIECLIERVAVTSDGEGWEAAARHARYQAFQAHLPVGGVLLLAHHQDDQLETLVMRLRQSKNTMSLAGIPKSRRLGGGLLFRPWLNIRRRLLEDVAVLHAWDWVEDESNQDSRFTRNWVRHFLLPAMHELDQSAEQKVVDLANATGRLKSLAARLVKAVLLCAPEPLSISPSALSSEKRLSMLPLLQMSEDGQRLVLREWFKSQSVRQPSAPIFDRIWTEFLTASVDAAPMLRWGSMCLRRYENALYLVDAASDCLVPEPIELAIEALPQQVSFGRFCLHLACADKPEARSNDIDYLCLPEGLQYVRIAVRSGGEKLATNAGAGSTSLKKLFTLQKVPPWERSARPLLWLGDRLAWVGVGLTGYEFSPDNLSDSYARVDGASNRWLSVRLTVNASH